MLCLRYRAHGYSLAAQRHLKALKSLKASGVVSLDSWNHHAEHLQHYRNLRGEILRSIRAARVAA